MDCDGLGLVDSKTALSLMECEDSIGNETIENSEQPGAEKATMDTLKDD